MTTYLVAENNVIVNAIIANTLEDAYEATKMEIIETNNGEPWIGWTKNNNQWIPPQPYPSWIWEEDEWSAPVEKPDGPYIWEWNEEELKWDRNPLPQPYPSWILDEDDLWIPPIPYPNDGKIYDWDEETQSWVLSEE